MTTPRSSGALLWAGRLLLVAVMLLAPHPALGQGANHAVLVTVFDADDVVTECIDFSGPEISGMEMLNRSALTVVTSAVVGQGNAVCKIGDVGCDFPGEECFCQCPGVPCAFWSLWLWQDGEWIASSRGADRTKVADGGMQAWVWSDGNIPPPAVNPASVCRLASAAPTTAPERPRFASNDEAYPGASEPPGGGGEEYPGPSQPGSIEPPEPVEPPLEEPTRAPATGAPTDDAPQAPEAPNRTPLPPVDAVDTPAPGSPPATRTPAVHRGDTAAQTDTPGPTITTDAAATLIARSAAELQLTPTPAPEEDTARARGYWVFVGLTGLLMIAVVYAVLVRRQQIQ